MIKKTIGLKVLILPASLAFVIMFAILYVKPATVEMMAMRKKVAVEKQEFESLRDQNAKLSALKAKWEAMDKKRVRAAMPEDQDIENYMAELYGRVNRSGAMLGDFSTELAGTSNNKFSYICGSVSAAPAAAATGVNAAPLPENAPGGAGLPAAFAPCAATASVGISVIGTWEQLLDLLKYLGDTNRIANITRVGVNPNSSQEGQGNGELLNSSISLQVFYKPKSETGNSSSIASLASGGDFNKKVLQLIESDKIIFSTYEEPLVSEDGERNIFK